jgi:hypothetical protein
MVSGKKKNNFIEDGKINEKIINKIIINLSLRDKNRR